MNLNLYNVSLKLTSATVASACTNSLPVLTFCLALLSRYSLPLLSVKLYERDELM
jgi:hypothetical protein